jgi:uncharacterized protein YycO
MLRRLLVLLLRPALWIIGKIAIPRVKNLDNDFTPFYLQTKIQKGDILLTRTDYILSNALIPGYWSHAVLAGPNQCVEAVDPKVRTVDTETLLRSKDYICILRKKGVTKEEQEALYSSALRKVGIKYDYSFEKTKRKLYCSELIYHVYNSVFGEGFIKAPSKDIFGVPYITPEDLGNMEDVFVSIYSTKI